MIDLKTSTPAKLRKMSPVEIDTELFPLWAEYARWIGYYYKIKADLASADSIAYRNEINRRSGEKSMQEYALNASQVADLIEPYDAEYKRRNGWSRYILVGAGHLHRWHTCSFVYPTTNTYLLAESSGMTPAEVVEHYSYTACTHCFPDAPVAAKPALDISIFCEGSGTYEVDDVKGSMRLYMPRGRCRKCNHMISVTSTGKLRKHKKES